MALITPQDIIKAAPVLNRLGGEFVASSVLKLMKLDKINMYYDQLYHLPSDEFIDSLIGILDFQYELAPEELENIPRKGAFITISNHTYGGIDGIILLKILPSARPDFKVLLNFLLSRIQPIEKYGFKVNPFEKVSQTQSSHGGIREALIHLKEGHPLGIFPAGEVASFHFSKLSITEKKWPRSILKLVKKARVPVIPVYFDGNNSLLFHLLGIIHPVLRTARLPAEMLNKSGKKIEVRIGRPISVREQDKLMDIKEYGRYLRMRTFSLGIQPEKRSRIMSFTFSNPKPVVEPVHSDLIIDEIEKLKPDCMLFSLNGFMVFFTSTERIPNIMTELGRLREITYREIGEGTNKSLDMDEFDPYYHQLFIWDKNEKKIIGGYRIGFGNHIIETYGIKGFYISSLFHIKDEFSSVLKLSMELGRSFIVKSHQKKSLSLFMLWKGILQVLFMHPEYRYLVGPVSISKEYRQLSKSLTVEFLKKYYFNKEFAAFFTPRKKFVPKINHVIKKRVFHKVTGNSVDRLENFIQAFDPSFQMPVLIKKYLRINAEAIGFNVDPVFNNCLDVLLITDIFDIPSETINKIH